MFSILRAASSITKSQTRSFAMSSRRADMARLTLIGRLGKDPQVRNTTNGKEYVLYTLATRNTPPPPNEDGSRQEPTTSWHSILSFNENSNNYLKTFKKGYQVYVEANYELRDADPSAEPDSPAAQRQIFLRHGSIKLLGKPPTSESHEGEESG